MALVGRPELVFLDEPTAGMDPQARRATWEIVRGLKRDSVTVMLTTHFMEEAEQLADRVAIVDRGKLVALDAPAALGQAGGPPDELRFRAAPGLPVTGLAGLAGFAEVLEARPGEYVATGQINPATVAALAFWLAERGALLAELRVGRQSLEDVFLRLTGDGADEPVSSVSRSEEVQIGG
jgi:ABC-2 type transport system ATP-binding protein